MSNLTKKLSNSRAGLFGFGFVCACAGAAIGISAYAYVANDAANRSDFDSSWHDEWTYPALDAPPAMNPFGDSSGMEITIPEGGHVWGQVKDFIAEEGDFLCMTPAQREKEVLLIVRRLERQQGRSLDLVFAGDRFVLKDAVVEKSEYFCSPPPVPKSSNPEDYSHPEGMPPAPAPMEPSTGSSSWECFDCEAVAPGAIETPRQAPPKESPGTGDFDPDFLPR